MITTEEDIYTPHACSPCNEERKQIYASGDIDKKAWKAMMAMELGKDWDPSDCERCGKKI